MTGRCANKQAKGERTNDTRSFFLIFSRISSLCPAVLATLFYRFAAGEDLSLLALEK